MFNSKTTRRPLLHYAVDLLAKKKYTINEMRGKLLNYSGKFDPAPDPAEIEKVINRLTELKYLNDSDYVGLYIDEQLRRAPQGIMMLKKRLSGKGIDRSLVEQVLQSRQINEFELAQNALQKKLRITAKIEPKKIVPKLYRFLISRGFSSSASIKAIEEKMGQTTLI